MTASYMDRMFLPNNAEIMKVIDEHAHSALDENALCSAIRELFKTDVQTIEEMQEEVHEVNIANGWFADDRTVGDDIALLHTEVSEMFEAYRSWGLEDATDDDHHLALDGILPKPEGFGSEVADVFIRLLDTCVRRDINLRGEYDRKVAFNRTRGWKHGGKSI